MNHASAAPEETAELEKQSEGNGRDDRTGELVSSLYEWVEAAVFSLLCVALIFTFVARIVGVEGNSMIPTLHNGERLIITRMPYTPKKGDIVIVNRYTDVPLVKRIVAVGGDTLEINDDTHQVLVNGQPVEETYTAGQTWRLGFPSGVQTVPEDCVFVMGDNRENSEDSRDMVMVGYVHESAIMGKAVFRFYPFSRWGGLYSHASAS